MYWYKNLKTDNEELDKKQKEFIDTVYKFKNTLSEDKNRADREVGNVVVYLVSYVTSYFAMEEEYLKNIGFKDLDKHIKMHTQFTNEILRILSLLRARKVFRPIQLHYLLSGWLNDHIFVEDAKFLINPSKIKDEKKIITNEKEIITMVEKGFRQIDSRFSGSDVNIKVKEDKRLEHLKNVYKSIDREPAIVGAIMTKSVTTLFDLGLINDEEFRRIGSFIKEL